MTTGAAVPGNSHRQAMLGLIADYFQNQGDDERAATVRKGTLDEAIRGLLLDLSHSESDRADADERAHKAGEAAELAESRLESATQPLAPEMERLNARVTALNGVINRMRTAARGNAPISEVFTILREEPEVPTFDLDRDAEDWKVILQAASESKWMPPEYMRNDWISDVCGWLRDGPPAAEKPPQEESADPYAPRCQKCSGPVRFDYCPHCGDTPSRRGRK